ncbi:hypothetical protein AVEN_55327-1 [Araneus ventricosus]|uniref:Uncharacterized protein n=1 Tax=Araneus ventricosus TaxID=182803 RepID=A0A4Y2DC82_ARAVE|nr:hypothetical protein AVEN_55327-1 [Araneus ventricosus]
MDLPRPLSSSQAAAVERHKVTSLSFISSGRKKWVGQGKPQLLHGILEEKVPKLASRHSYSQMDQLHRTAIRDQQPIFTFSYTKRKYCNRQKIRTRDFDESPRFRPP